MYTEEQKVDSKLIMVIFSICALMAFLGIAYAIMIEIENNNSAALSSLYGVAVFMSIGIVLAYLAVFRTTLELQIDDKSISFRFFPFVHKQTSIAFETISTWELRKIKNIFDYGGYGYKKDFIQKKTGFIMGGKDIFEFRLTNGKTIAFTSANKELMYSELKKYIPNKEIR